MIIMLKPFTVCGYFHSEIYQRGFWWDHDKKKTVTPKCQLFLSCVLSFTLWRVWHPDQWSFSAIICQLWWVVWDLTTKRDSCLISDDEGKLTENELFTKKLFELSYWASAASFHTFHQGEIGILCYVSILMSLYIKIKTKIKIVIHIIEKQTVCCWMQMAILFGQCSLISLALSLFPRYTTINLNPHCFVFVSLF